jgi:tRNA threonylcarbamoyladenosine biosynthesis protein TsaB
MILAIDTSTSQAGVALGSAGGMRGEISWRAARHSTQLFRALDALLELAESGVEDLEALAVAIGPGSFSGIRVGMSACKALAMALEIPLVGVSTLEVTASASCGPKTCAVVPAGRGQYYLALYAVAGGRVVRESDYQVLKLSEAAEYVSSGDRIVGEASPEMSELLGAVPESVRACAEVGLRRASLLAELGRAYFAEGGRDQAYEAEPLYLRRSAAEENRDAAQR